MKTPPLLLFFTVLMAGLIPVKAAAQRTVPQTQAESRVADWLAENRDRPTQLRAFIQQMPKGADLHSHLSGAVYAESYLEWAQKAGYCVDTNQLALIAPADCNSGHVAAQDLTNNTELYNALIDRWSTRNLEFAGQPGHDQFFEAFAGFDSISNDPNLKDDMVAEVANRAASQNIHYLELMLTVQSSAVRKIGREIPWTQDFAQIRNQLLQDARFQALIQQGVQDIATLEQQQRNTLGCDSATPQPGCEVTVRYLQQTNRIKEAPEVFAQLVYAVELAKASPYVVGINLVAPEDHPTALRDYTLQMEMLGFLRRQNPEVKIALHAGELTLGLVPPQNLRFHIRQAVEIAQANRIGHGVDIFYEENPWQLLETMRKKGVLVEICLTSNEVILGVSGAEHPFLDYWQAGVPVTLASDDEGISRIDLSHEYWRATQTYNLGYPTLKKLARNSLEYSFLPGESLWKSPDFQFMVEACAGDNPQENRLSQDCEEFLASHERARHQWQLEAEFGMFEASLR